MLFGGVHASCYGRRASNRFLFYLFGCDFSELLEIEQTIPTCDETMNWNKPAADLLREHVYETETLSDSDENSEIVCEHT